MTADMPINHLLCPNQPQNPWTAIEEAEVYQNPWIRVVHQQVINPAGNQGIYGLVHFKNKAIGIIPVDHEMNTWLVGQYRYPLQEYSWEIPMGGGPVHQDIYLSAHRELREETGLQAGKLTLLMRLHTSNSVTDEEGFVFLAEDLKEGPTAFEETEDLKILKLPFATALEMVLNQDITDALSVAGILKAARVLGV